MKPDQAQKLTKAFAQLEHPRTDFRTPEGKASSQFLIPLVEKYVVPGTRVLDLGCGMGGTSFQVASLGANVTGVDCSEDAVARAREIAESTGLAARFVRGDYTDLPFEEGAFDAAVLPNNITECSYGECERVVDGVSRVLAPGGHFIVTMRDSLALIQNEGASQVRAWEIETGVYNGTVNIPNLEPIEYPTYFWTVAFAKLILGRQLDFVEFQELEKGRQLLVCRKP